MTERSAFMPLPEKTPLREDLASSENETGPTSTPNEIAIPYSLPRNGVKVLSTGLADRTFPLQMDSETGKEA